MQFYSANHNLINVIDTVIDNVISESTGVLLMVSRVPIIMPPPMSLAQIAVLMVDGSGSMAVPLAAGNETSKADTVLKVTKEFVSVLKDSKIKDSFWLSSFAFNTSISSMLPSGKEYLKVSQIDPDQISHPLAVLESKGRTDFAMALTQALRTAQAFRRDLNIPVDPKYRRAVVILLSDGLHNEGNVEHVHKIASQISNMWPLCTVAFGKDADTTLLKSIATDVRFFLPTVDPDRLRAFFVHSSTLERK